MLEDFIFFKVHQYVKNNYTPDESWNSSLQKIAFDTLYGEFEKISKARREKFAEVLLRMIREKGMTEPQCYKNARVDRRTFSKIINKENYMPSKEIVLALAIGLRLNLEETKELVEASGWALSKHFVLDLIVEYCIKNEEYDIATINDVLWAFGQELLGSKVK